MTALLGIVIGTGRITESNKGHDRVDWQDRLFGAHAA